MKNETVHNLKKLLATPKNIVIIPHKNPDGDAIGSTLGLYHYLLAEGHNTRVIAPNDYPEFLKWMPGENTILKFDSEEKQATEIIKKADLIFTLDFNSLHRIEEMRSLLESLNSTFVMIDHHQQPDNYASFMYSDTSMSSTCEMVYNFIGFLGDHDKITRDIATCLYTGIMTDTGSFKFSCTTSTTHRTAADLIDRGADNATIQNSVFNTYSTNQLQLLGCALKNMIYLEEFRTAYISLSKKELETFGFKKGDTEGFVNNGLLIKGAVFSVIFIENTQEPFIKISLRSKGHFSVNDIAREHFGGGGHLNAAGGRSDLSLEETIAYFKKILPQYKEKLLS